jgi:methyl-accepting chemotaxis protein
MARSSDSVFPLSLIRDKTFQMRQLRRVLLLAGFFILQSTLLLGVFHYQLLGSLVSGNAPLLFASEDIARLADAVPSVGDIMSRWLFVMLALNAVVTAVIGTWIVRKLGNPILAMRRALNDIGDGKLNTRLRAGDSNEFAEIAEALNRAVATVQQRVADAQAATAILDSLEDQPSPDAQQMRVALENCREKLSWFDSASLSAPAAEPDQQQASGSGRA